MEVLALSVATIPALATDTVCCSFRIRRGNAYHGLMENGTCLIIHFVELIDAADALIGKDKCSALQYSFMGVRILSDVRCESYGTRTLSTGIDTPGCQLVDISKTLEARPIR